MTNDELLADLGRIALLADPPPRLTYELGYAAFSLRTVDHELAVLIDDSALHDDALAGVRGDSAVRMLFYQGADVGVELHVMRREGRSPALGQVIGYQFSMVRVELPDEEHLVTVDDLGRFDLELPRGLFRLHLEDPDRPTVTTGWTNL
jgi:chloramphenicol 3-O-phosphotransferase